MLTTKDILAGFIEHLEHVRQRPGPFVGAYTEVAIRTYLVGFNTACRLCGYEQEDRVFWEVCAERGWEMNTLGPQKLMNDAGWAEHDIVDEMIIIEIETWKKMQSQLPASETS